MAKAIIEIQAQALEVGDHFDTRCGVADYAWAEITRVEHFTLPGGGDRVEITYRYLLGPFNEHTTSRIVLPGTEVRIRVEVPDAPARQFTENAPTASGHARRVCPPQDRQPTHPHRPARKPGRYDSVTRRLHNLRLVAERVNAGVVTVAQYLAEIGADSETIRKYASQVGKRAKALAAAKGVTPALSGLAVVGHHLARCLAYARTDVEILRQAVAAYPKTSHLVTIGA